MTLRTCLSTAAVTALLTGVFVTMSVPADAACRSSVRTTAVGNWEFATRITARNRWRAAVRDKYGRGFATWTRATNKDERCDKQGPGRKWLCKAIARPCN